MTPGVDGGAWGSRSHIKSPSKVERQGDEILGLGADHQSAIIDRLDCEIGASAREMR